MLCFVLYAICLSLLLSVSSMVFSMLLVILSAYKIARPFIFLAALPIVCVNDFTFLKKPSLSASKIATKETSGKSKPSRNKFTPIKTSNKPLRKSCIISTRSKVSTSECMYLQRMSTLARYFVNSSAILLVSVVTSVRSFFSTLICISSIKSSIWFKLGLTSIIGSSKPVGLIICSTKTPSVFCSS